jgi:hypothetical protein
VVLESRLLLSDFLKSLFSQGSIPYLWECLWRRAYGLNDVLAVEIASWIKLAESVPSQGALKDWLMVLVVAIVMANAKSIPHGIVPGFRFMRD